MLRRYSPSSPSEARACLANRSLVFIGDSMARRLFFALRVALGESSEDDFAKMNRFRDGRHDIKDPATGLSVSFLWDPFLNETDWGSLKRHSLPIVSAGLWHLRHFDEAAQAAFERSVRSLLDGWWSRSPQASSPILIRLLSPVVWDKLSPERQKTLLPASLQKLNRFLRALSVPVLNAVFPPLVSEALHTVYASLPNPSAKTEDGLHYDYAVVSAEISIFLNGFCNGGHLLSSNQTSFKKMTACCHPGPVLSPKNHIFIIVLTLFALFCLGWRGLHQGTTSCAIMAVSRHLYL